MSKFCPAPFIKTKPSIPKRTQWSRSRRYIRPQTIPRATPRMSATQSFISALRLKLGWMSSIRPPKALAPTNTGINPKRPVLERGKESAVKAMMCTNLSRPSGAGGGAFRGQSIATVRIRVTMRVIGMSRYLRIMRGYWSHRLNATISYKTKGLLQKWKVLVYQG